MIRPARPSDTEDRMRRVRPHDDAAFPTRETVPPPAGIPLHGAGARIAALAAADGATPDTLATATRIAAQHRRTHRSDRTCRSSGLREGDVMTARTDAAEGALLPARQPRRPA